MTLLDFIVIGVVLLVAHFVPLPFGVALFVVCALILERLLKRERL